MKHDLLPNLPSFKANLHTHTNLSDAKLSPAEQKEAYVKAGYSIIAFTEHDVIFDHSHLADENFLPLIGYELAINDTNDTVGRTCHFCFIATDPDNIEQPYIYPSPYLPEGVKPNFVPHYTPEHISEMMRVGREKGFFISYNHPTWSQESYPQYMNYHGMHAVEIVNYGIKSTGYHEINHRVYDDMLKGGERIFCTASDDNHNIYPFESPYSDSFGAFTMIRAEKLEYRTITKALLDGNFYASQKPLINDLWVEDGEVHVTCSPVSQIYYSTGIRNAAILNAEGAPLTEATFKINPNDRYFRLTLTDDHNLSAFTSAYFLVTLPAECLTK